MRTVPTRSKYFTRPAMGLTLGDGIYSPRFQKCKILLLCSEYSDGEAKYRVPANLITGKPCVSGATPFIWARDHGGPCLQANNYDSQLFIGYADVLLPTKQGTICLIHRKTDAGNPSSTAFCTDSGTNYLHGCIGYGDNIYFSVGSNWTHTGYTLDQKIHRWVFRFGPRWGQSVWRDGIKMVEEPTQISGRSASSPTEQFVIGKGQWSGDYTKYYWFSVHDEEWSLEEIRTWTANPWTVFVDRDQEARGLLPGIEAFATGFWESLAGVSQEISAFWESLIGLYAEKATPWESISAPFKEAEVWWESCSRAEQQAIVFWESLFGAVAATVNWESRGAVEASATAFYESLKQAMQTAETPYEALKGLAQWGVISWESLIKVFQTARVNYEPHGTGTDQGVKPSEVLGVLPEIGSAIYTFWSNTRMREVTVHEHRDGHTTARLNYDTTRQQWDLKMEVNASMRGEIWDFILAHYGAGIAFYFYDLQNNNFVWDEDGIIEDGRYKVRFMNDRFPQEYRVGNRFAFEFSVVEVE